MRKRRARWMLLVLAVAVAWWVRGSRTPPSRETRLFAPIGGQVHALQSDGNVTAVLVDHALRAFVNHGGAIDLLTLRSQGADIMAGIIQKMVEIDPRKLSIPGQRAFLLNLTNSLYLYALATIDITGVLPEGALDHVHVELIGWERPLRVSAFRREFLSQFGDPRLVLAVTDGTVHGGHLHWKAYTSTTLEALLDENTREFFHDPAQFQVSPDAGQILASPLLRQYLTLFGGTREGILRFARTVGQVGLSEERTFRLTWMDWDRRLFTASPCDPESGVRIEPNADRNATLRELRDALKGTSAQ